jgi:hypothetical protein
MSESCWALLTGQIGAFCAFFSLFLWRLAPEIFADKQVALRPTVSQEKRMSLGDFEAETGF